MLTDFNDHVGWNQINNLFSSYSANLVNLAFFFIYQRDVILADDCKRPNFKLNYSNI